MQSDLRFMGRDLKVRNQWKHSDAIACNTWDVWCSILRSIAFAFRLAPAKVELHLWSRLRWGRVCVCLCVFCQSSEAPSFSTCDGCYWVIQMQVDGSQLAFSRYSARHTGNNNHSFVSPTRFHHVWMFGFQRLADYSHQCFTKRDMQLYGLSPCHPSAYCLFFFLFVSLSPPQFPWMSLPQTLRGAASMSISERDKRRRSQWLTLTPAVGESTSPCWRAVACPSDCQVQNTRWVKPCPHTPGYFSTHFIS